MRNKSNCRRATSWELRFRHQQIAPLHADDLHPLPPHESRCVALADSRMQGSAHPATNEGSLRTSQGSSLAGDSSHLGRKPKSRHTRSARIETLSSVHQGRTVEKGCTSWPKAQGLTLTRASELYPPTPFATDSVPRRFARKPAVALSAKRWETTRSAPQHPPSLGSLRPQKFATGLPALLGSKSRQSRGHQASTREPRKFVYGRG